MIALGVDTSNYATSLAVVNADGQEVVCAIKRLLPVRKGKLGLRQSDAVFHHTAALPSLLKELGAKVDLSTIGAVGVSAKPRPQEGSYMPCFLAGVCFAAAFAAGKGVALTQTSHQQGHIASARFGTQNTALQNGPALVFHLSGGTTDLLLTDGYTVCKQLGSSRDLYAGQAVDRLGVLLGFSFPAGAALSNLALECEESIVPKISVRGCDCHLSGLENQCKALLGEEKSPAYVAKYCLLAIADTALAMARAARKSGHSKLPLVCAGGVMSSGIIREHMQNKMDDIWFVPPEYAGDNAVGVALIAAKAAQRRFDVGPRETVGALAQKELADGECN